ncbi:MAG: hypothetical protein IT336_09185, partial [Thermomicrobiales bacterium]|nr:hypothetical protein [Thermomicrobiales bacterium]
DEATEVTLHPEVTAEIALSTELDRDGAIDLNQLDLRPNEGVVIRLGH